jgi:hypothetical protein
MMLGLVDTRLLYAADNTVLQSTKHIGRWFYLCPRPNHVDLMTPDHIFTELPLFQILGI